MDTTDLQSMPEDELIRLLQQHAALKEAHEIFREHTIYNVSVCIADPSSALQPFAVDLDGLLASAISDLPGTAPQHASTRHAASHQQVASKAQCIDCTPEAFECPLTPLAVVAAAERLLARLSFSGKALDVVVRRGGGRLWPTASLRLLRESLKAHLAITSAQAPSLRLRVIEVRLGGDTTTASSRAPGGDGQPGAPLQEHTSKSTTVPTLKEYLASAVPAAFVLDDASICAPRSLLRRLSHALHVRTRHALTVPAGLGRHLDPAAEALCHAVPILSSLCCTALEAGRNGVTLVALSDIENRGTATYGPSRLLATNTEAHERFSAYLATRTALTAPPGSQLIEPTQANTTPGVTIADRLAAEGSEASAMHMTRQALHMAQTRGAISALQAKTWSVHVEVMRALPLHDRAANIRADAASWSKVVALIDGVSADLHELLEERCSDALLATQGRSASGMRLVPAEEAEVASAFFTASELHSMLVDPYDPRLLALLSIPSASDALLRKLGMLDALRDLQELTPSSDAVAAEVLSSFSVGPAQPVQHTSTHLRNLGQSVLHQLTKYDPGFSWGRLQPLFASSATDAGAASGAPAGASGEVDSSDASSMTSTSQFSASDGCGHANPADEAAVSWWAEGSSEPHEGGSDDGTLVPERSHGANGKQRALVSEPAAAARGTHGWTQRQLYDAAHASVGEGGRLITFDDPAELDLQSKHRAQQEQVSTGNPRFAQRAKQKQSGFLKTYAETLAAGRKTSLRTQQTYLQPALETKTDEPAAKKKLKGKPSVSQAVRANSAKVTREQAVKKALLRVAGWVKQAEQAAHPDDAVRELLKNEEDLKAPLEASEDALPTVLTHLWFYSALLHHQRAAYDASVQRSGEHSSASIKLEMYSVARFVVHTYLPHIQAAEARKDAASNDNRPRSGSSRRQALPLVPALLAARETLARAAGDFARLPSFKHAMDTATGSSELLKQVAQTLRNAGWGPLAHALLEGGNLAVASDGKQASSSLRDAAAAAEIAEVQLKQAGSYLARVPDARPDPRVSFQPDSWQKEMLDAVDAHHSLLVSAPTSAGKTFVSYYAMKAVLEHNARSTSDKMQRVVYLMPTKALLLQTQGDLYMRYESFINTKNNGQVFGTWNRDQRVPSDVRELLKLPILLTMPAILEIILMDPSMSKWLASVEWVICDEVHNIIDPSMGATYERILSMLPCPVIALSATIGNARQMHTWLTRVQAQHGNTMAPLVEHTQRYSDLCLKIYLPSALESNTGGPASLDARNTSSAALVGLHPIALYAMQTGSSLARAGNNDKTMDLSPVEAWQLYCELLRTFDTSARPLPTAPGGLPGLAGSINSDEGAPHAPHQPVDHLKGLHPGEFFLSDLFITQPRARQWARALLSRLMVVDAAQDTAGQVTLRVASALLAPVRERYAAMVDAMMSAQGSASCGAPDEQQGCNEGEALARLAMTHTMPLLDELNRQQQLPVIGFHLDRTGCTKLCLSVFAELKRRMPFDVDQRRLDREELIADIRELSKKIEDAGGSRAPKAKQRELETLTEEYEVKCRELRKLPALDRSVAFVHPRRSIEDDDAAHDFLQQLEGIPWAASGSNKLLVEALSFGVGVHHSGLHMKYRRTVEALFRLGHVRVIFATGTLAQGINMPARTVAFVADSPYLNPVSYKQMAGRAGRRGYDVDGNIVFLGFRLERIAALVCAELPTIHGNMLLSPPMTLRTLHLLSGLKHSKDTARIDEARVRGVAALLTAPLALFMGHSGMREQMQHTLLFSSELLFQHALVDGTLQPRGFAPMVERLYYYDRSASLFLVALLYTGSLQRAAEAAGDAQARAVRIFEILAYVFNQLPLPASYQHRQNEPDRAIRPLTTIAPECAAVIVAANEAALDRQCAYLSSLTDTASADPGNGPAHHALTYSGLTVKAWTPAASAACPPGGDPGLFTQDSEPGRLSMLPARLRSPFFALLGLGDRFQDVNELRDTVKDGLQVMLADVPVLETNRPLDDAVVHFFRTAAGLPETSACAVATYKAVLVRNRLKDAHFYGLLKDWTLLLSALQRVALQGRYPLFDEALAALASKMRTLLELIEFY